MIDYNFIATRAGYFLIGVMVGMGVLVIVFLTHGL